ncbi:DUF488 domain-containing protein [Candidatus Parvarchaeota archaeon]|nr:DUF488 domain-containing protein [Candidatus Parvarchaeota archaeon]
MKGEKIYTIGHSTRSIKEFIGILKKNGISELIDIRTLPGSRFNPQFNAGNLRRSLKKEDIGYIWIKELGGLRKGLGKKSPNKCWKNKSFRGYADYMMTNDFKAGVEKLIKESKHMRVVIMCAESVYWRCHRMLIADYLKANGFSVYHIMSMNKKTLHKYSECAKVKRQKLTYI